MEKEDEIIESSNIAPINTPRKSGGLNKKTIAIICIVLVVALVLLSIGLACYFILNKVEYNATFYVEDKAVTTIKVGKKDIDTLPLATKKIGYAFEGWYFDKDTFADPCTVDTIASKKFTADVSVYAKLTKEAYSITYDLDGGEIDVASHKVYFVDSPMFQLLTPTKVGYVFTGWSSAHLQGDANTTVYIHSGSTGNRVYKAHWLKLN